jgi:hypothetical protein
MGSAVAVAEHDINGPSKLDQREACPGSAHQEALVPDEGPTPWTDRGNGLHARATDIARGNSRIVDHTDLPPADLDELMVATEAVEEARARMPSDALLLLDYRVDLAPLGIPVGGSLDVALVVPGGPAWLADWKFGRMWVRHPRRSRQVQGYAWGLRDGFGCTSVEGAMVQPSAPHPVLSHTWTGEELDAIGNEIRAIVDRTKDPRAPLIAGDQCDRCRARSTCPRRVEIAAVAATLPDPVEAMRNTPAADRAAMWQRLELAVETLRDARDAIERAAIEGTLEIPGYGIGSGRASREWADPVAAEVVLMSMALDRGVPMERIVKRELCSVAEAEAVLGKAKATVAALAPHINRKPGRAKLVHKGKE